MPALADPRTRHPLIFPGGAAHDGTVFLSAAIDHPRWEIGDYTYASSFDPPKDWAARLAPHLHQHAPERLILGRFCQIAHGATFITSSANHRMDGLSTFPFAIFSGFGADRPSLPGPEAARDTVIGHDVWIGQGAMILPGARIGTGAIIGAGSVVSGEVPPYAIVAGNRAEVVRMRFDDATIARLLAVAWWHWPPERIIEAEAAICGDDIEALERG
jgi:virginiamycin A acetyltransferase